MLCMHVLKDTDQSDGEESIADCVIEFTPSPSTRKEQHKLRCDHAEYKHGT